MVRVENVQVMQEDEFSTLVGMIDGQEAWFRYPAFIRSELRGEPFLAYALLLAMSRGEDIEIDPAAPLSPLLMRRLPVIQSILRLWNPEFRHAELNASSAVMPRFNPGVLSAFSGGVDSSSTLVDHLDEITHIMTLNSFDEGGPISEDFAGLEAKNRFVAAELGKIFVPIETNARQVCRAFNMGWTYVHGPLLCLIAVSLGFDRFYIPSSYTYRELKPWGSHPVLDPYWRTEATEIIHDGGHLRRSQKVENIARTPAVLKHLQVCWNSKTTNCGICSKCARTQIVLGLLSVEGAPFPASDPARLIDELTINSDLSASFALDIMQLAQERGAVEIAAALRSRLRRYAIRQSASRFAKQLIGRRGLHLYDKWRQPGWRKPGVRIIDPDNLIA